MSEFLATAYVKISPQIRGFKTQLDSDINKAIKGREYFVQIKAKPDFRGFIGQVNTALRGIEGSIKALKVPVIPVVGKAAAASGAAGGSGKDSNRTNQLSDAQKRARATTELLTQSFKLNEQAAKIMNIATNRAVFETTELAQTEVRLTGASAALQAVEKGLAKAIESGNQAAIARLASTRQLLLNTQAENQAVITAASNEKALAGVREKSALASQKANIALTQNLGLVQKANAFSEAEYAVKTQLTTVESLLAAARKVNNTELAAALATEQASLAALQGRVLAEGEVFAAQAKESLAATSLKKARAELSAVVKTEISGLTTLAEVKAVESSLNKAVKAEEKAVAAARDANIVAVNAESIALERNVAAQYALIAAQKQAIKGAAAQATAQAAASRGALATFLSLLGARGATLAAGSEFLAGAAAVAVFAKAISSASQLETQLNVFQETVGATGDEMEKVRDKALQLGADITLPAVGAGDAARAFTELGKAGLEVEDAVDGARGVLQLATAAELDNAQATELVASGLNAFGLAGIQATRVADLLTGAANAAQGSVADMGIALQQSSAVARQAGLSISDTVSFITLLAKSGIRGSDAGTSLRTALLRLIAPTEDANKELKKLGVTIFDLDQNFRPEAFAEIADALADLDAKTRNQTLRKIFGQDAIRAAVIFGREGSKGLDAVRESVGEAGLAQELAAARTKGFAGSVEALKNSLETLGTNVGSLVLGPIKLYVDIVAEAVSITNSWASSAVKAGKILRDFIDRFAKVKIGPVEVDGTDAEDDAAKVATKIAGIFFKSRVIPLPVVLGLEGSEEIRGRLGLIKTDAEVAQASVRKVLEELNAKGAGSPTALNAAALALADIIRKLQDGSPAAQKLSGDVQILLENIQNADFSLPPFKVPELDIPPSLRSGSFGREVIDPSINVMRGAFPELFALGDDMTKQLKAGAESGVPAVVDVFKSIIPKITTAVLDLQEQFNKEVVAGNRQGQISNLKQQAAEQQRIIDEANKAIGTLDASKPGGPTKLAKLKEARRQAQGELASITSQVEGIENSITADAKSKADEIQKAKDEQDDALLKIFSNAEDDANLRLTIAEGTKSLKDDIAANKHLRAVLIQQRAEGKKKIKDLEDRRDFVRETTAKIKRLGLEIKQAIKDQRQAQREAAREQRERAIAGIELDIEFAEITKNRGLEIRLRNKLIDALEEQIKHEKGNTNRIKELRNEIARQKQAIKEANERSRGEEQSLQRVGLRVLAAAAGLRSQSARQPHPDGSERWAGRWHSSSRWWKFCVRDCTYTVQANIRYLYESCHR